MHTVLVFTLSFFVILFLAAGYLIIRKKAGSNGFITLLVYVFSIIFLLRMCVNISMESDKLGIFETIMDSFVHTLQSFSMDEDYTMFVMGGKNALGGATVSAEVYGVVISILNAMAPILGGAIILDILTGLFPRLKIIFNPQREKFIFSELNINSITLAEDIVRDCNYNRLITNEQKSFFIKQKPLIIFTDAYPDSKSESISELFERAKAIKAICLSTDIKHLPVKKSRSVFYFLIDNDEHTNLESVNDLLNEPGCRILWPKPCDNNGLRATTIIVLSQSDYSVNLVNHILNKRKETIHEVLVRPIRDYSNMAMNLVRDIPLFTALADKKTAEPVSAGMSEYVFTPQNTLHVTLIGSGGIAEEFFKTVFWCGQIAGYQLHIHVISKTAKDMRDRIEHDCPELFRSCDSHDDILKIYPYRKDSKYAPPYAVCNDFIDNIDAEYVQDYPDHILSDTDYFLVALGSDEKNIHTAAVLSREIHRRHLEEGKDIHPVIVPIVFDDQLADTVRNGMPESYEPYMLPYGTLSDRFSCKNIFMVETRDHSQKNGELYDASKQEARVQDEYSYWANTTKSYHAKYKLFSLYNYLNIPLSWKFGDDLCPERISITENDDNDRIIAWMEHRRWNAYLRSCGFSCPTDRQLARFTASSPKHDHKNISLKIHSCLVEADLEKRPLDLRHLTTQNLPEYDSLDFVSIYDSLLKQVLSNGVCASEILEKFFDKNSLLYESKIESLEKDGIFSEKLSIKDYKRYDGIAHDMELQSLVDYQE